MSKTISRSVVSSSKVRATKPIRDVVGAGGGDCGCVGDEGCCKDKGCCREGKCPAEAGWLEIGCSGDDFTLKVKDREDLVRDYILQNKASVAEFFKARGVQIRQ